jgi:hypothetical protein
MNQQFGSIQLEKLKQDSLKFVDQLYKSFPAPEFLELREIILKSRTIEELQYNLAKFQQKLMQQFSQLQQQFVTKQSNSNQTNIIAGHNADSQRLWKVAAIPAAIPAILATIKAIGQFVAAVLAFQTAMSAFEHAKIKSTGNYFNTQDIEAPIGRQRIRLNSEYSFAKGGFSGHFAFTLAPTEYVSVVLHSFIEQIDNQITETLKNEVSYILSHHRGDLIRQLNKDQRDVLVFSIVDQLKRMSGFYELKNKYHERTSGSQERYQDLRSVLNNLNYFLKAYDQTLTRMPARAFDPVDINSEISILQSIVNPSNAAYVAELYQSQSQSGTSGSVLSPRSGSLITGRQQTDFRRPTTSTSRQPSSHSYSTGTNPLEGAFKSKSGQPALSTGGIR